MPPQELLRTYFTALPRYQGVPLSQLSFRRVLFGGFPSYPASPLKPAFDRVLQVTSASAEHENMLPSCLSIAIACLQSDVGFQA